MTSSRLPERTNVRGPQVYDSADLFSIFLLGVIFGALGLLAVLIHVGRKANR